MRLLLPLACLLAAATAPVAQACSPVPGYRVPTTLELAERADTILIGTVTGEDRRDQSFPHIRVTPTLLLKGPELPGEVAVMGMLQTRELRARRSDPSELRAPNPDALRGACTRFLYREGARLLLFFERENGQLRFAGYPFARVSEDVGSDNALWVKAVRLYIEVAALPESERRPALVARRAVLRARADDVEAQALADDIDRELAQQRTPPRD